MTNQDAPDLSQSAPSPASNLANSGPPGIARGPFDDIVWKDAPFTLGCGMCMGTADVVPGVSGGTMAVALGIYGRLLAAISSINVTALRALLRLDHQTLLSTLHWRFLGCLVSGIGIAVVIMVKIVKLPKLLQTSPELVYAVFFGLVLGSIVVLARRMPGWTMGRVLVATLSTAVGFAIVTLVPVRTPDSTLSMFASGVASICAMLLPGISGSFILLVLGKYETVLGALEDLMHLRLEALSIVLPFALGCLCGVMAFARFLGWLLQRWHDTVLSGLVGLLLGSLWRIWPYQHLEQEEIRGKLRVVGAHAYFPEHFEFSIGLLMFVGLGIVFGIEIIAARRR